MSTHFREGLCRSSVILKLSSSRLELCRALRWFDGKLQCRSPKDNVFCYYLCSGGGGGAIIKPLKLINVRTKLLVKKQHSQLLLALLFDSYYFT